jgi:ribosomal protein L35
LTFVEVLIPVDDWLESSPLFYLFSSGKIKFMRPGHRHKRFVKSSKQNRNLSKSKVLHDAYATTMKRLGFTMRSF